MADQQPQNAALLRTPPFDDQGKWSRAWALYFMGTTSHRTGPLTGGSLLVGNDGADIKTGDLSGDATTAGSTAVTLAASGVSAGTYGDATDVAQITVDAKGRVTAATTVAIAVGQITSLTGAVTASGPGAAAATLNAASVVAAIQTTGAFTPVLKFGGSATGITYSVQVGDYCKVGNLVTARLTIVLTSKGAQTGAATITGMPFTSNASGNRFGGSFGFIGGMSGLTTPYVSMNNNVTALDLIDLGAGANVSNTNFGNSTNLQISISYYV